MIRRRWKRTYRVSHIHFNCNKKINEERKNVYAAHTIDSYFMNNYKLPIRTHSEVSCLFARISVGSTQEWKENGQKMLLNCSWRDRKKEKEMRGRGSVRRSKTKIEI